MSLPLPSEWRAWFWDIIQLSKDETSTKIFSTGRYPMDVTALFTRIEKTIEVKAGIIVLENPNGFPYKETNLYLVDRHGEIVWKAEKPDPYTSFSRVKLNEDGDTFSAYTLGGHACELELRSGKLISFTSFK